MGKHTYKAWLTIILALGFVTEPFAQKFGPVTFDQLPLSFQLYARNDSNQAIVPISGLVSTSGYSAVSLVTYRNKKPLA